jgi:hypothetical protein
MFLPRNSPKIPARNLDWSASLDHPDQYNDDRQNQQNVDKTAQGVRGDQAEEPQNHEYYRYCPEQVHSPVSLK